MEDEKRDFIPEPVLEDKDDSTFLESLEDTLNDDEEADDDTIVDEELDMAGQQGEGLDEEPAQPIAKKVSLQEKYIDERRKRQAAEALLAQQTVKIAAYEEKVEDADVIRFRNDKKDKYVKAGYRPELAVMLAEDLAETYKIAKAKTEKPVDKYEGQITALKTTNEFYDNADAYAQQIKDKMQKFEKLGEPITVQQAYMMIVDPTVRQKEIDQRGTATGRRVQAPTAQPMSGGGAAGSSTRSTLSPEQQKILRMLQKQDPTYWNEKTFKENYS